MEIAKTTIELTANELIEILAEKTGEQIKCIDGPQGEKIESVKLVINRAGFSPAKGEKQ